MTVGSITEVQIGRRLIYFSDHALERYYGWDRKGGVTVNDLRADLEGATWSRTQPPWVRLSAFNKGRTEGFLMLDDERCFAVVQNDQGDGTRDRVAVSFFTKDWNDRKER